MALKDLQKLKKSVETPVEKRFFRYLVVGQDLFSLALYQTLVEKYGEAEVGIVSKRKIERNDLFLKGPSSLRGKANIEQFKTLYPEVELNHVEKNSSFYKEMKFREFGGRAKSETLLWGEEFFVDQAARFDLKKVFSFLNDEDFFNKISEKAIVRLPLSVEATTPDDLIDNANWSLTCTDGLQVNCEKIFWGENPAQFLELMNNKEKLSDQFIEFCDATRTPASLYVKFSFDKALTERDETLFLPLSYTHEWGHFIGEFESNSNEVQTGQDVEFVSFLVPEQTNEEEISKKIRILKRNLEKIFSDFKTNIPRESITLHENSACLKIDDSLYDEVRKSFKNIFFTSVNGPIEVLPKSENNFEYSRENLSHMVRGLTNLEQTKANLL